MRIVSHEALCCGGPMGAARPVSELARGILWCATTDHLPAESRKRAESRRVIVDQYRLADWHVDPVEHLTEETLRIFGLQRPDRARATQLIHGVGKGRNTPRVRFEAVHVVGGQYPPHIAVQATQLANQTRMSSHYRNLPA
jgi:hypothetical protein